MELTALGVCTGEATESFVQGADVGWIRTGRATADEAAGKEMGSEMGALLHLVARLPALLSPKPQVAATTFGTLSQTGLLPLRSLLPTPPPPKACASVPLYFSTPTQRCSPALLCAQALSCATAAPGTQSGIRPTASTPAATRCGLLGSKLWEMETEKWKTIFLKKKQFMPAASDKQVRKIPSSTRLRATPIAEGEEARGWWGRPRCSTHLWFWRAASPPHPVSGPAPAFLHVGLSLARCLHALPATPWLQAQRQMESPKTHVQRHLTHSKTWHDGWMLHPGLAPTAGSVQPAPMGIWWRESLKSLPGHWNTQVHFF